jgi:hypothetical protein
VLVSCLNTSEALKGRWNQIVANGVDLGYWSPEPGEPNPFAPPGALEIYGIFNRTTRVIAEQAALKLQASLDQADHAPHAALLLSFLQVFSQVQADANRFTDRHLDFYFRKALQLSERASTPDKAHVYFEVAPEAAPFVLDRGVGLTAGTDPAGAPIVFALDQSVELSRVRIGRIASLALRRGVRAGSRDAPVESIVARPVANSADGLGAPLPDPGSGWPAFGLDAGSGPSPVRAGADAEIGLLIRSPFLCLRAGARRLTVTLVFDSGRSLQERVAEHLAATRASLGGPAARAARDEDIIASAFCFALVGTADDRAVTAEAILAGVADGRLGFALAFDPAAPPLAPPAQPTTTGAPGAAPPALRITLNAAGAARVFGYSSFEGLRLSAVELDVAVTGLAPLALQTALGPIDPSKPFLPFGPFAPCGAALIFSHPDLFGKRLGALTLALRWAGLPAPPATLDDVYAGYGAGLTSGSFKGSVSALSDYRWTPIARLAPAANASAADGSTAFPLFEFDGSGAARPAAWSFDVSALEAAAPPAQAPLLWDPTCRAGFFRLELTDPPIGFGQQAYPQLVAATVTANAASPNSKPKPLPAPPIAPTVASIAIDFTAHLALPVARAPTGRDPARDEGVYRFGPFGLQTDIVDFLLLPTFAENGYLLIGLDDLAPSRCATLLFHVQSSAADCFVTARDGADETGANPVLKLRYFSGTIWKEFPATCVMQDTTESLSRSGIIALQFPADAGGSPAARLEDLAWLQISVDRPEHYGRVIDIKVQGATATRIGPLGPKAIAPNLPAGSIAGLAQKNASVLRVGQPFATEQGRLAEDERQFRIRVSERLRHKQRAILPRDYESLILEAFPSIGDAKCLTRKEARLYGAPTGDVVVVVAPLRVEGVDPAQPRVPEYLLREIGAFLLDKCPASVSRIRVLNPEYERVRVSAWLGFGRGDRAAFLREVWQAIDRHIAPWRADPAQPLPIGVGQVQLASLLTALGQLDCAPDVRGLSVVHLYRDPAPLTPCASRARAFNRLRDTARTQFAQDEGAPWWPWSVLIPATDHQLHLLDGPTGIDVLGLERDFVVARGPGDLFKPPEKAGIGNLEIDVDLLVRAGIGNLAIQDDFIIG